MRVIKGALKACMEIRGWLVGYEGRKGGYGRLRLNTALHPSYTVM